MTELKEILGAISEMRTDLEVNHAVNVKEHETINKELNRMNGNLEKQNGRITILEHFKTSLKTRQILIPTAISLFIGGAGLALKFM
jgi:hypothetical protein